MVLLTHENHKVPNSVNELSAKTRNNYTPTINYWTFLTLESRQNYKTGYKSVERIMWTKDRKIVM